MPKFTISYRRINQLIKVAVIVGTITIVAALFIPLVLGVN